MFMASINSSGVIFLGFPLSLREVDFPCLSDAVIFITIEPCLNGTPGKYPWVAVFISEG